LIALDRNDQRGDLIACALLAVSLSFQSIGLAFAVGALVELALNPRRRVARSYVGLLPLSLFAIWWLGWGHTAESEFTLSNLIGMPGFMFNAAAAGVTSLLGLPIGDGYGSDEPYLIFGKVVVLAALALGVFRLLRGGRPSSGLIMVLAIALAFWGLVALNNNFLRPPTASRYQYPSAIFLLLIVGEAFRGRRIPAPVLRVGYLLGAVAVFGGILLALRWYSTFWVPEGERLRSSLAAVEIARGHFDPKFMVNAGGILVPPQTYFSATDEYGSPAYSPAGLSNSPEIDRVGADDTLVDALGIGLVPLDRFRPSSRCQTAIATATKFPSLKLRGGSFELTSQGAGRIMLRLGRYSEGYPVTLGSLDPDSTVRLAIPRDRQAVPWHLGPVGNGAVRLCAIRPDTANEIRTSSSLRAAAESPQAHRRG
jgi:hypothetical protein